MNNSKFNYSSTPLIYYYSVRNLNKETSDHKDAEWRVRTLELRKAFMLHISSDHTHAWNPKYHMCVHMCVWVIKSMCIMTFLQKAWELCKNFKEEKGQDLARSSLLLTECFCCSKIHILRSNPQCDSMNQEAGSH